jgi:hypothetical protein
MTNCRVSVFLCSDDAQAKSVVKGLAEELGFISLAPPPLPIRNGSDRPRRMSVRIQFVCALTSFVFILQAVTLLTDVHAN